MRVCDVDPSMVSLRVVRGLRRQNLDGALATRLPIAGVVHLTHPALADLLVDLTLTDLCAGFERAVQVCPRTGPDGFQSA